MILRFFWPNQVLKYKLVGPFQGVACGAFLLSKYLSNIFLFRQKTCVWVPLIHIGPPPKYWERPVGEAKYIKLPKTCRQNFLQTFVLDYFIKRRLLDLQILTFRWFLKISQFFYIIWVVPLGQVLSMWEEAERKKKACPQTEHYICRPLPLPCHYV